MSGQQNNAGRSAPRRGPGDGAASEGKSGNIDRAVNLVLDMEAAGNHARASELLRRAAEGSPAAAAEVAARAASLRAAHAQLREQVQTPDLVSRVLDQWEREELVGGPVRHGAPADIVDQSVFSSGGIGSSAAGTTASQTRHRRLPRRLRAGNWTTAIALLLGAAVALTLAWPLRDPSTRVVATVQAPTSAPAAASDLTMQPGVIGDDQPVLPLRLTNAGAYDHLPPSMQPLAARPARIHYGDLPSQLTRPEPANTWVFAGLTVIPRTPPAPAASTEDDAPLPLLEELLGSLKLPAKPPVDEARLRLNAGGDQPPK